MIFNIWLGCILIYSNQQISTKQRLRTSYPLHKVRFSLAKLNPNINSNSNSNLNSYLGQPWFNKSMMANEFKTIAKEFILPVLPVKIIRFLEVTGGTNFVENRTKGIKIIINNDNLGVLRQLENSELEQYNGTMVLNNGIKLKEMLTEALKIQDGNTQQSKIKLIRQKILKVTLNPNPNPNPNPNLQHKNP